MQSALALSARLFALSPIAALIHRPRYQMMEQIATDLSWTALEKYCTLCIDSSALSFVFKTAPLCLGSPQRKQMRKAQRITLNYVAVAGQLRPGRCLWLRQYESLPGLLFLLHNTASTSCSAVCSLQLQAMAVALHHLSQQQKSNIPGACYSRTHHCLRHRHGRYRLLD